jgi:exosome complex component RRP4
MLMARQLQSGVACLQVQQLSKRDNSIALHMRGSKYRKLRHGQVVQVPAFSIRRRSSHFINITEKGVQIIIGCNGWLWIGPLDPASVSKQMGTMPRRFGGMTEDADENSTSSYSPTAEQWQMAARFAQAGRCLARLGLPLHRKSLEAVVDESLTMGIASSRMLDMEFLTAAIYLEEASRESDCTAEHAMQVA